MSKNKPQYITCSECGESRTVKRVFKRKYGDLCASCASRKAQVFTLPEGLVRGDTIGRSSQSIYKLTPCPQCKRERWLRVNVFKETPACVTTRLCNKCAPRNTMASNYGERNGNWKGGRRVNGNGYVEVRIGREDFFFPMATHRFYVREHRLVMARHLGRCLQPWETVHHKNGIKTDNRITNLSLQTAHTHSKDHSQGYLDGYEKGLVDGRDHQIQQLKQEIRLLRLEVKQALSRDEDAQKIAMEYCAHRDG